MILVTEFYHVKASRKDRRDSAVQLDLTKEDLEKEIIRPYLDKRTFYCGGYSLDREQVDKLTISKSTEPSSAIRKRLEEEDMKASKNSDFASMGIGDWEIVESADDVTSQYLKQAEPWYDAAQVCKNGHLTNTSFTRKPERNRDRCPECGAETITRCPDCKLAIRGDLHEPYFEYAGRHPPSNCTKCGADFPWKTKLTSTTNVITALSRLQDVLSRFQDNIRPLRARKRDRPPFKIENEYDVQDCLHVILKVLFDDVRPEEWTPSYAGGSSRMDFLIKDEKIVVEAKMTSDGVRDKQLGEQLIIDIEKYKSSCSNLICFIYDPDDLIENRTSLKRDLEKLSKDGLKVVVIINP